MRRQTPSPTDCVYALRPYPKALGRPSGDKRLARSESPPPNALGGLRGVGFRRRKGALR